MVLKMKIFDKRKRMNKKGQMMVLNIMVAFTCIVTAIIFIEPLKEVIGLGNTALNCANYALLTTGQAMTCIVLDIILPVFFLTCVGVGIAYLGAKQIGY
jgi:hypothetical protein